MREWKSGYYSVPSNLHRILDTVYEQVILMYLMQLTNGNDNRVHPSEDTLSQGLMSPPTVDKAISGLVAKGFVNKYPQHQPLSNEYTLNYDRITSALFNKLSPEELKKGYTAEQIRAMNLRACIIDPTIPHQAESKLGNYVVDKNGVMKAQPKETGLINFESEVKENE